MNQESRPRIGITMRLELETNRFYLARFYSEAVEAAGGLPVNIPLIPSPDFITGVMASLDGLLLPGSDSDVDPRRYGREPHPNLGSVHPEKDETDLLALAAAEAAAMPVFAICFGLQSLNVSRGGTLIQGSDSQYANASKHQQGVPRGRTSHSVRMLEGSLHGRCGVCDSARVNSQYHRAGEAERGVLVRPKGACNGLFGAAECPAIERFVIGLQT